LVNVSPHYRKTFSFPQSAALDEFAETRTART